MSNPQLLNYINQQLANGVSQEKIKSDLLSVGWHEYELEDAFRSVQPAYQEPLRQSVSQPDGQLGPQVAAQPATADLTSQSIPEEIAPGQIAEAAEAKPIDTSLPGTQGHRLAKDDLYKDVLGPVYSQKSAPQLKPLKTPIEIILLPIVAVLLLIGGGVFAYFHYFRGPDQIARIIEMSNKVVLAMAEVRSASYEMLINIEIDPATMPEMGTGFNGAAMPIPLQGPLMGIGEGMSKMEVNLSGNFDVRNANRPEGSLEVAISANDGPQVFGMEA